MVSDPNLLCIYFRRVAVVFSKTGSNSRAQLLALEKQTVR
jgi:hypothetical protein